MSDLTSKALKDEFCQMITEKPLHQITVKDLVKRCGLNRNSFYYHFQDMPDLIDQIIKEKVDYCIQLMSKMDNFEEATEFALKYIFERKTMVLHLFNSVSRDTFERELFSICKYMVESYIDSIVSGRAVKEDDKELLVKLLQCMNFGIVISWLTEGMKDDLMEPFRRFCYMNKVHVENIIIESIYD